MLREIRELRHPFFGSEGPPVDERPAKRVAVEGITLSKRMQTEPAINPPSKKTTKNSKRASGESCAGRLYVSYQADGVVLVKQPAAPQEPR